MKIYKCMFVHPKTHLLLRQIAILSCWVLFWMIFLTKLFKQKITYIYMYYQYDLANR